jgi:hypothetical protein
MIDQMVNAIGVQHELAQDANVVGIAQLIEPFQGL